MEKNNGKKIEKGKNTLLNNFKEQIDFYIQLINSKKTADEIINYIVENNLLKIFLKSLFMVLFIKNDEGIYELFDMLEYIYNTRGEVFLREFLLKLQEIINQKFSKREKRDLFSGLLTIFGRKNRFMEENVWKSKDILNFRGGIQQDIKWSLMVALLNLNKIEASTFQVDLERIISIVKENYVFGEQISLEDYLIFQSIDSFFAPYSYLAKLIEIVFLTFSEDKEKIEEIYNNFRFNLKKIYDEQFLEFISLIQEIDLREYLDNSEINFISILKEVEEETGIKIGDTVDDYYIFWEKLLKDMAISLHFLVILLAQSKEIDIFDKDLIIDNGEERINLNFNFKRLNFEEVIGNFIDIDGKFQELKLRHKLSEFSQIFYFLNIFVETFLKFAYCKSNNNYLVKKYYTSFYILFINLFRLVVKGRVFLGLLEEIKDLGESSGIINSNEEIKKLILEYILINHYLPFVLENLDFPTLEKLDKNLYEIINRNGKINLYPETEIFFKFLSQKDIVNSIETDLEAIISGFLTGDGEYFVTDYKKRLLELFDLIHNYFIKYDIFNYGEISGEE